MRPILPSELGFNPENTPAVTPISMAEAQDLRARIRSLQDDWKLVVAQAVASAKLAESLAPRLADLEQRVKALDEIASKLHDLSAKVDELSERTTPLLPMGSSTYVNELVEEMAHRPEMQDPPKKKTRKK